MPVEIVIKKSRFIGYVVGIEEFEEKLAKLKKEHKKARHIAWAYRYLEDKILREKYNDDGEPSGTAGRPILHVMQQKEIEGRAVLVVRYFGGIKLGAGGLVRAYRKCAALALDKVM